MLILRHDNMLLSLSSLTRLSPFAIALLLLSPLGLRAQYTYTTNNGTITLTKFTCASCPLAIPATINGLPVTTIGAGAFKGCGGITSVTIPVGVTAIEADAFRSCTGLSSVTLPGSVVSLGEGAFAQCSALKSLVIPESITTIPTFAFFACTGLTNVSIPNSVTVLQNFAFGACNSLPAITLPTNLVSIGSFAISGCANLTEITLSKSVKTIGVGAFASCTKLQNIQVELGSSTFSSVGGVLFDKNLTTLVQFPGGRSDAFEIPNGVTKIQDAAFKGANLKSVSLPGTVARLGDQAFNTCVNLKSLYFQGNAPLEGGALFVNTRLATAYVSSSATGWGPTYGERPVKVLNPLLSLGTISGARRAIEFPFSIGTSLDQTYVIEACTSLVNQVWVPIGTRLTSSGAAEFVDVDRTNYPSRFYRVRSE